MDAADIVLEYVLPSQNDTTGVYFGTLDHYSNETMGRAIVHGVSVGSCTILAVVLLIFTANRRKTPVFLLNMTSLLLMVIRSALNITYLYGPLNSLSFAFTGIVSETQKKAFGVVVATGAFQVLSVASVEASMVFQVFTVFRMQDTKRLGYAVSSLAATLGVLVVVFYIYAVTRDTQSSRAVLNAVSDVPHSPAWVKNLPNILFCVSVNYFNFVLVMKMIFAIRTRRYLGLKQFHAVHVLVVMGAQSMVVPSVLAIVNYSTNYFMNPALSFAHVLIIVLSLPISSMWAASANDATHVPSAFTTLYKQNTETSADRTLHENSLFHKKYADSVAESWSPKDLEDMEKRVYGV